jgi:hypothetical protein
MHIVSALKTLFGVVTYALALSAFYSMSPQWYTWHKIILLVLLFAVSFTVVEIVETIVENVVVVALVSTATQIFRWLTCFMLAQFFRLAVEDLALHWGLDMLGTIMAVAAVVVVLLPLMLPVILKFCLLWCDCGQSTCFVCQLCKKARKQNTSCGGHDLGVVGAGV